MRPKPRTAEGDLYYALTAPLPNADLNIKLTANYLNTRQKGNLIHSQIFIDGKDITFLDAENGSKKIVFDIVAVTLNEKNELVDDTNPPRP